MESENSAMLPAIPAETQQLPQITRPGVKVLCIKCSHQWTALYLPMKSTEVAKVVGGLHCPSCSADAREIMVTP